MLYQSKIIKTDEFAPIELPSDFPVSRPERTFRAEISPIGPHIHDCFELGYCYEGSGVFLVGNKILPFRGGDAVVINDRELHIMVGQRDAPAGWDFINLRPAEMLAEYVCEEEKFLDTSVLCGSDFKNIISAAEHPDISALVRDIMSELSYGRDGYRSLVRSMVWMLLVKLHRISVPKTPGTGMVHQKLDRLKPALEYIARHYGDELDVDFLAARCHTSTANFRKMFHAALDMAPVDYIKKLRLKVATVMLTSTDRPIGEIALESGYSTWSNFNRQFQENYRMSPREFRTLHSR